VVIQVAAAEALAVVVTALATDAVLPSVEAPAADTALVVDAVSLPVEALTADTHSDRLMRVDIAEDKRFPLLHELQLLE
jgi:hypothetical protein